MSADGRYVLFGTQSVAGLGGAQQVLVRRDRTLATTVLAGLSPSGATVSAYTGSLSGDGRYVAFRNSEISVVHGDVPMYVRDMLTGTTVIAGSASRASFGAPQISASGRYLAFASDDATLVPNDTNGLEDFFVRDLQTSVVDRVSLNPDGSQETLPVGGFDYGRTAPSISADGRYVGYYTLTSSGGGTRGAVMLRDRTAGTTDHIDSDDVSLPGATHFQPRVSDDGRFVIYQGVFSTSPATTYRFYLHDRSNGTTTRIDVPANGAPPDGEQQSFFTQLHSALSGDGRFAAFDSFSSNLVPGDTNDMIDVFLARVS